MAETAASDLPLAARIQSAALDYSTALAVAARLGDQLAAAHASGRVHGHLTCASVFLAWFDGRLRVTLHGLDTSAPDGASSADDVLAYGQLLAEMHACLERSGHPLPDWQDVIRQCCHPDPALRPSILQAMRLLDLPVSEETLPVSSSAAAPLSREQPRAWGPFHLLQRLGQGAFGEVYRAWDPVLEREVALKLLLPRGLDPGQQYAELLAEARAVARVRHPNIVSVYGVDRHDGRVGFWSDFVRGRTLSRVIETSGPLPAAEAASILIALCEALSAVHDAGLLHRDIKGSNAMRDENGRILLMDFGLSQELGSNTGIAGTPAYMAPELLAGHPPSVAADIYAMGILLQYLCTGSLPGIGHASVEALPSIATPLDRIVRKATAQDPQQRYLSAARLREALIAAQAELSAPSLSAAKPRHSLRRIVAAACLLLIAAAASLYPLLRQRARARAAGADSLSAFQEYQAAEARLSRYDIPGNTQKAIQLFQQTLALQPNFPLAKAGLAGAFWRMYLDTSDQQWADKASQAAADAARMDPSLPEVQLTLGSIHVAQGQFSLGMQELDQARQSDPDNAAVYGALGEAYRQAGRLADAKKQFQTAMDLEPNNWRWPFLLGALQIDDGEFPAAEANLKTALAHTPDNSHVLFDLGLVYKKQGRMSDAVSVLAKALALDPEEYTMMALGGAYLLEGDMAKAVPLYQQAVRANPGDWNAWGNLAATEQWSGADPRQAARDFQHAVDLARPQLAITPDNPFLVYRLAFFYASLHDADRALPMIRKSLLLAPGDPDLVESDAESYELLGDREHALSLIRQALQLRFSADYVRKVPDLQALRKDPRAPQEIRENSQIPFKGQ